MTSPARDSPPGISSTSATPGSCTSTAGEHPAPPNVGAATSRRCVPPGSEPPDRRPRPARRHRGARPRRRPAAPRPRGVRAADGGVRLQRSVRRRLSRRASGGPESAVSEDHSVVGFDSGRIARSLWTQLTTVGQNIPAAQPVRGRPGGDPHPGQADREAGADRTGTRDSTLERAPDPWPGLGSQP